MYNLHHYQSTIVLLYILKLRLFSTKAPGPSIERLFSTKDPDPTILDIHRNCVLYKSSQDTRAEDQDPLTKLQVISSYM